MRQRVLRREIVDGVRLAHVRGEAVRRDLDALDARGIGSHLREDLFQRVQCRVDRIAARAQAEIVASDLPAVPQFFGDGLRPEAVADQLPEGLFDGVRLCGDAGERQLGRERSGEAAHPAGDVERGRARHGVRVAGCEHECRADPERQAHLRAGHRAQPRPGRHGPQQRRLAVLMGYRPRRQPRAESSGHFVAEDQRGQGFPTRAFQPFGARQRRRQHLHGALAGDCL